jgi:hypothetical protein
MFMTIRNAAATAEMDERQIMLLSASACPQAALAALGIVLGRILDVIVRDRRQVRSWLSQSSEAAA